MLDVLHNQTLAKKKKVSIERYNLDLLVYIEKIFVNINKKYVLFIQRVLDDRYFRNVWCALIKISICFIVITNNNV